MIVVLRRGWALALCSLPLFCLGGVFGSLYITERSGSAVIVIDPGHGGIDGGCQDGQGNLEKDLNLAIARRVAVRLSEAGVTARLTREDDRELGVTYGKDLLARLDMARDGRAVALISVHANWIHDPSAEGALAVIPPDSPASTELAEAVLARLRGICRVNPTPLVMTDHPLLASTSFPIVLLETGFLSNPTEAAHLRLPSHQDAIARAIALAIKDYLRVRPAPAHGSLSE